MAAVLNTVPKYVVSATPATPQWHNSRLIDGDVRAGIEKVKKDHDEVYVNGSARLCQSLLAFDLVDRLQLWIAPLALGRGKKLFDAVPYTTFSLSEVMTFPGTGVTALSLDRTGAPATT